ncbi:protein VAC14 homolog isoform X2 [Cimex lectularius]|uniref:Protein VAC14 homolog n=1 Tax=Cimex lectularius TaxID=79782 RepID=A0A8I6TDD7_CIMLE|nr:protein VAC14 homolog isoform X2 [Cimex lectularius]
MTDRGTNDHAPLSVACVRALIDKQYDKRKAAATEIEKMVKEFVAVNNTVQIRKVLKVLGTEFTTSQNINYRKGGLIGLAAVGVALGKDSAEYTEALITPILSVFSDNDSRIRYFACEALYNVVKVARGAVLPYFADIFTGLSKLVTETDQVLKNGSEMLDRLMKDIVTENATFDLVGFMPLLRERLYSKNTFARQYIISWVTVLDAVPDIQLILFLPEILDGLFTMLYDPQVKSMCENVLSEFLRSINKDPTQVDFTKMINVLITHSQSADETLQITALTWINDFIQLSGEEMLAYTSGILTAILPCLAYEGDNKKKIKDIATLVNTSLMELIKPIQPGSSDQKSEEQLEVVNELDLPSLLSILKKQLLHTHVQTKVASLKWIYYLQCCMPKKMLSQVDAIFPRLLQVLSDHSDEVVQQVIRVLAQIISPESQIPVSTPSPYFDKFLVSLLKQFREERQLLEERGSFIIRQLCVLLSAEDIYKNTAVILMDEEDLKFARVMVDTLNTILLTSSELYHLRTQLKNTENEGLFQFLYETWCHNPVATISLCLITQNYAHVCDLIEILANYEVTVEFLVEIDRLVQLIESPIFNYLRLELLKIPHNYYLIRSMYGLLMILPQSETFHILRHRLECVPKLHFYYYTRNIKGSPSQSEIPDNGNKYNLDFDYFKRHFIKIQDLHRAKKNGKNVGF